MRKIIMMLLLLAISFSNNIMAYQLSIASENPNNGVYVYADIIDNYGNGSGDTWFRLIYDNNTMVKITAPSTVTGHTFKHWIVDGTTMTEGTRKIGIWLDKDKTATAVFEAPSTGSLKVNITPSSAVSDGAQWRVDYGTWRNSGYTQSGLSVGSHTLEYKNIDEWTEPDDRTVGINGGLTTTVSGNYIENPQYGNLKVIISPDNAISAGAKWRVDYGTWRNSGETQTGLSVGSHDLEYKTITGWTKPNDRDVGINKNLTTTIYGTYLQDKGNLKVNILPSAAVSAGAQWRVDGGSWRNSSYTQSGLSVGSHTIEYKTISDWTKPGNESVSISKNSTTTESGTYSQDTGSLKVNILPSAAVSAGAQWRVDGGSWRNSSYTQSDLSVGSHTIEYKTINEWSKPGNENVTIYKNQTTTESGTYSHDKGNLKVNITPSSAISAGAQWQVDGGNWHNSGETQSGLSVGNHTIKCKPISGCTPPADVIALINKDQTTTKTMIYDCGSDNYHPADTNSDWKLIMSEAVTYAAQWKDGIHDKLGHVVRAGYIWKNGENYEDKGGEEPGCWDVTN